MSTLSAILDQNIITCYYKKSAHFVIAINKSQGEN
jgi:hypothetical protein